MSSEDGRTGEMTRRDFVRSSAAVAGAGWALGSPALWAQEAAATRGAEDELAVALIGPGSQGRNLLNNCLNIPGLRFVPIFDIWEYLRKYAANIDRNIVV